jgi:hypothetical protein
MEQLRRSRSDVSAIFRGVAANLCAGGIRFSKLMPIHNQRVLGPLTAGPGMDEELDFSWIPGAQRVTWSGDAQRDTLFRWALSAVARREEQVAIIWHPALAGVRLAEAAARSEARLLLDAGRGDTIWVAGAKGGAWLIQVAFWSATVSYACNVPVRTDSI